mgnify:CR=1 FL=1
MEKRKQVSHSIMLAMAAFIWGIAFVAQSTGGDALGPYAFNGIRNLIATLVVLFMILVRDKMGIGVKPNNAEEKKTLWKTGILCGTALFVASTFQQVGINMGTPVGKAGFLTATYIVIVPIVGLFFKKHCGWNVFVGAVLMLIGIYLLSIKEDFSIGFSDGLILICAICFTVQIMMIDMLVKAQDPVRVACIQFLTTGILSMPFAFIFDMHGFSGLANWSVCLTSKEAWFSLLFAAVFSSGVAYTFQMVGQQGVNPALASMLMSMESMFSVLAGWVILREVLTVKELTGCGIMFVAVILAQLPLSKEKV